MKTLYTLVKLIENIASTQPNVRFVTEQNIYDVLDTNNSVKYAVFNIVQNTHVSKEDTIEYGFSFIYGDRLQDNLEENRLQIQSIGIQVIDNILKILEDKYEVEVSEHNYQAFTQRFLDEVAGVMCNVTLTVYKDWNCADMYEEIPVMTITKNGVYNIGGFTVKINIGD